MPRRCALGCPSSGAILHCFPNFKKDPERFKVWRRIVGSGIGNISDQEIYRKKRVCDIHFKQTDRNRNNRLNILAVPSLFVPGVAMDAIQMPETINAASNLSNVVNTTSSRPNNIAVAMDVFQPEEPSQTRNVNLANNLIKPLRKEIMNLKREICRLRKRGKTFKSRIANAEKLTNSAAFQKVILPMTKPAKLFTAMQFRLTSKKAKGRRFTLKEKILSLSLYKKSPKAYTMLSKYFILPGAKSLKRLLAHIKIQPGINKPIFEKIKQTIKEKNVEDRLCTLIFDEMALSPQIHYDAARDAFKGFASHGTNAIADHALVFMVKGIKANFKQPVAYYFTSNINKIELKNVIKDVIIQVQDTGLIILCTVCDQSAVNVGAVNELVEDTKKNFLLF